MLVTMTKVKRVLADVIANFNDADGWAMASHVALSMMMALFPFLIFATAMAGFLGHEVRASDMVDLVFATWPDQVAEPITREIEAVLNGSHYGFLTVGIALALFFASNGVDAVRVALNRSYLVHEDRSFVFCRLKCLLFVILGAIVLIVVSFLLALVPLLSAFAEKAVPYLKEYETTFWFVRFCLAIFALAFALFASHAWLPAGRRPISDLWPGILATLVIWLAAAGLFAKYLENFADYGATFAGLAGVMTAQIFLYLMAVILILGGDLNAAILRIRTVRRTPAGQN